MSNTLEGLNDQQFTNYMKFLLKYFESYFHEFEQALQNCKTVIIDDKLELLNNIIYLIINYTHNSKRFSQEFHTNDGLKYIIDYLRVLINKTQRLEAKNYFINQAEIFAGILFNLSKLRDMFREEWKELNVFKFLYETINSVIIQNYEIFSEVYIVFITTIAFIFQEEELIFLSDLQQGISQISELVGRCALCLSKDEASRKEYKSMIDHEIRFEAHYLDNGWNVIELLECLYRYSIVDSLKCKIYEDVIDHLRAVPKTRNAECGMRKIF